MAIDNREGRLPRVVLPDNLVKRLAKGVGIDRPAATQHDDLVVGHGVGHEAADVPDLLLRVGDRRELAHDWVTTRSAAGPRKAGFGRHSTTSSVGRKRGKRSSNEASAVAPSARASEAPKQKWLAQPNARCRLSGRPTSSSSGSRN